MTNLNQSSGQRIDYIDLLKGFAMFVVVLVHSGVYQPVFLLRMYEYLLLQLFFFVAGMFVSFRKPLHSIIIGKINRLLVPFLFFNLVYLLLRFHNGWMQDYMFPSGSFHDLATASFWQKIYTAFTRPCNAPLWFLPFMFFASIIFHILVKVLHEKPWTLFISVVLTGGIGIYLTSYANLDIPDDQIMSLPARLSRFADRTRIIIAMTMIPIMYAGYMFRLSGLHQGHRSPKVSFFIIAVAGTVYGLSYFTDLPNLFTTCWRPVHYIFSLCTIAIVVVLAQWIGRWEPLDIIGRNSIMVLGIHMCVIANLYDIVPRLWGTTLPLLAITLLICFTCFKPMKRWVPALSGNADLIQIRTS